MAKTVEFKYELDDVVAITAIDKRGVISMLGVDEGGNTYYVKSSDGGSWWKENQLKIVE